MEIKEIVSVIIALTVVIGGLMYLDRVAMKKAYERDKERVDYFIREFRFLLEETIKS